MTTEHRTIRRCNDLRDHAKATTQPPGRRQRSQEFGRLPSGYYRDSLSGRVYTAPEIFGCFTT